MFRFDKKEILLILFFCILGLDSYAAVTHVANVKSGKAVISSPVEQKSCYQQGFRKTSCVKGSVPKDRCSTNENYFKTCICDKEIYKFSENNCDKSTGASLTGSSCTDDNNVKNYKNCKCNSAFKICEKGFVTEATLCIDDEGYKHNGCVEDIPTCESINYLSVVPQGYQCTQVKNQYMTCYKDCNKI